jgi:hypothetical protein
VRVPDEAAGGKATVTLSMAGWKEDRVSPVTFEIDVAEPPRRK